MKRLGVFTDVSNLYYCIGKRYQHRKLDYRKYLDFLKEIGEIKQAIAYGGQVDDEAAGFIYSLQNIGYTPKFKTVKSYKADDDKSKLRRKADWDVGITIDIVNMIDRFDVIVLGSADGDMRPTVEWCRNKGVDVIVIACGISKDLKESANKYIEIPESLLEDVKE